MTEYKGSSSHRKFSQVVECGVRIFDRVTKVSMVVQVTTSIQYFRRTGLLKSKFAEKIKKWTQIT